jgi:hypothetical protein
MVMNRPGANVGILSAVVVAACLAITAAFVAAPPAPAAPASAGCAACHVAGKVATLDASLKKIKNHPQLPAPTVAMCTACHKASGKAAPLGPALHRRHLVARAFTATYKGSCTSCHAVDTKTGAVTVIGLPPR